MKLRIYLIHPDGGGKDLKQFQEIAEPTDQLLSYIANMNYRTRADIEANDFALLKQAIAERIQHATDSPQSSRTSN